EEGLFSEEHKKKMPSYVKTIGVITSETGAAVKDIVNVVQRRNSAVDILIFPAIVQGEGAPESLIRGLRYFNGKCNVKVDVIIIGRGGGSIEELWAFNNEELAKEIYKSKIPVVSAVGHEIDFTICDFVADLRAATPSAAAEMVTVPKGEYYKKVLDIEDRIGILMREMIRRARTDIIHFEKILKMNSPQNLIVNRYRELEDLKDALDKSITMKINFEKQNLTKLNNILEAKNPLNILSRGYVILENELGKVVSSKENLESGRYKINFKDGYKKVQIELINE
ncbi:MAG: exodeoxyribonuclease VII large subunit, partial [Clostridiaceae bacterium]